MATRTVRLDPESEDALRRVREATGMPVSDVLKRGVRALAREVAGDGPSPYAIYAALDLGPGGYAHAPSHLAKPALPALLCKKSKALRGARPIRRAVRLKP